MGFFTWNWKKFNLSFVREIFLWRISICETNNFPSFKSTYCYWYLYEKNPFIFSWKKIIISYFLFKKYSIFSKKTQTNNLWIFYLEIEIKWLFQDFVEKCSIHLFIIEVVYIFIEIEVYIPTVVQNSIHKLLYIISLWIIK